MRHGLIGVTSLHAYHSAILSGYETSSFFKRAAVMCDHIFIDTQGLPADSTTLSKIQDDFIYMLVGGKEAPSLAKSREFRRLIIRPQDLGDEEDIIRELYPRGPWEEREQKLYEAAFSTIKDLTDQQLETIAIRRDDDYKKQGTLILELVTDLNRASRLKRWLDEPVGLLTPLHQRVLTACLSGDDQPVASPFLISAELEQLGAIDFAALSWPEILRLRRSSFRNDFRDRLDAISRSGDINVSEALWQDLWRIAREARPSALRTTITGIIGGAPLPLATPLGVVATIAETQRAHELAHEFGWLFFILAANPALP